MAAKRTYDNSLREKRAQETREKIITALSELIANLSLSEVSVPKVAEAAGVSEPTVYRYFPNRDALLEALDSRWQQEYQLPGQPQTLDDIPEHVEKLFLEFDDRRDLVLALFKSEGAWDARKTLRRKRLSAMREAVDNATPYLEADEQERMFGVIQLLASSDAWRHLEQYAGLKGEESGPAIAWAIRTLVADMRRRNARAKKKGGGRDE